MRILFVILAIFSAAACGPRLIRGPQIAKDADIEDNLLNHEILDTVERYRVAMEQRDISKLLEMAGKNYFEQAGTSTTEDDYGYDGLEKVLKERLSKLKTLRMRIVVYSIAIEENHANVDYTYHGRFQVQGVNRATWAQKVWESRLKLEKVDGRWFIISGM
jgi:hypothetical protein